MKHLGFVLIFGILLLSACGGEEVVSVDSIGPGLDIPDFIQTGSDADVVEDQWVIPDMNLPDGYKPDFDGPDMGDVVPVDTVLEDTNGLCTSAHTFGCPCDNNGDCFSNFCIDSPFGKVCTEICTNECPFEWSCETVSTGIDVASICIPLDLNLCRPCTDSDECNGINESGNICVSHGNEGAFCGKSCPAAGDCPEGYECATVTSIDGDTVDQCVPVDGALCECNEFFAVGGFITECVVQNDFGGCFGERSCSEDALLPCDAPEPAAETCNGVDDDCDGAVDEDIDPEPCPISNDIGTCTGYTACVEGEPVCEGDEATDETCNGVDDDCDGQTDQGFLDTDGDFVADCVDPDDDDDGIYDDGDGTGNPSDNKCASGKTIGCDDNCPLMANPDQLDTDGDEKGDVCDQDDDGDGSSDNLDCAPLDPTINPAATEVCNGKDDNCNSITDEGFPDMDGDNIADCVDPDADADGIPGDGNSSGVVGDSPCPSGAVMGCDDNCPLTPNSDQSDLDNDTIGDACDDDDDNDGTPDNIDCAPTNANIYIGAVEECDGLDNNCSAGTDEGFPNSDDDNLADCIDDDDDNDGILDDGDGSAFAGDNPCADGVTEGCDDNCRTVANPDQADTDGDGLGDACDEDSDSDGIADADDNCPSIANPEQENNDLDDYGDVCDDDDDNDGILDDGDGSGTIGDNLCASGVTEGCDDNCVFTANGDQVDTDGDSLGDACDDDDDGDEILDTGDNCPLVQNNDQANWDGDEQGDACDLDDDNDGDPDTTDCDDNNNLVYTGATENCSTAYDDNCNGQTNEINATGCTVYYADTDGDSYGDPLNSACYCTTSAPYITTNKQDCCDANAQVHPGQTAWFTSAATGCNGSWDYNCLNGVEKQYGEQVGSCGGWPTCTGGDGWVSSAAACGEQKKWQTDCSFTLFDGCESSTVTRTQGCH